MKTTLLSCSAILGICLGFVSAVPAYEKPDVSIQSALFKTLDKNQDGIITSEEVGEERAKFFKRLIRVGDDDKDGQLSQDEFLAATKPDPKETAVVEGQESDNDQPGAKKAKEKKANGKKAKGNKGKQNAAKQFQRLDSNKDDLVTQDEIDADGVSERLKKRVEQVFKKLGKQEISLADYKQSFNANDQADGQTKQKPTAKTPGDEPPMPGQMFKRLDKDGDGKLTLSEVPEKFKPRLAKMLNAAGKDEAGNLNLNEFKRVARSQSDVGEPPRRGPEAGDRPKGPPERGRMDGPPRPPALFGKLDTNKDRRLSKEELAKVVELFDELDNDADGTLDPRELFGSPDRRGPDGDRPRPPRGGPGRRSTDDAADRPTPASQAEGRRSGFGRPPFLEGLGRLEGGKVSIEKVLDDMKQRLEKLDSNGDGFIEVAEFREGHPGAMMDRRARRERPGRPNRSNDPKADPKDRPEDNDGPRVGFRRRFIQRLDENDDGKISAEEAVGPLKSDFEKIDSNSDGYLDADELRSLRPDRPNRPARRKSGESNDESKESTQGKPAKNDA